MSNSDFAYKSFIFSLTLLLVLPLLISIYAPAVQASDEDKILDDYYDFTGTSRSFTKESVWVLTGVYTPYENVGYGITDDGWLYGQRIGGYTPYQYIGSNTGEFSVVYDKDSGYYRYAENSADFDEDKGQGHKKGDIYTHITFDSEHKSNIFFSESAKFTRDGTRYVQGSNEPFYFSFTGWRYAFQPTTDYNTTDGDGNVKKVIATTTSLSLVWYFYYSQTGISGQLILSGSDGGVAYISGDQIVRAFDSITSTARFDMTFNQGVQMGIYIRLDPNALAKGVSIKDAYDQGFWSIMVTSKTTDSSAYTGTDYSLNIWNLFEVITDLMTFNYADYNMSPMMGAICSFVIIIPLYAGLIALAIGSWQSMAFVGILAAIQGILAVITNWSLW